MWYLIHSPSGGSNSETTHQRQLRENVLHPLNDKRDDGLTEAEAK